MSNEITGQVWNGSVPIRITFKNTEYLLEAKRILYFPVYFSQLLDFFYVATNLEGPHTRSVWLEYENVPLKWNMPIGLLHDLLYLHGHSHDPERAPWSLNLKISSAEQPYPAEHVIPFVSNNYTSCLNQVYINSLKQSCYVIYGNSRPVMNLSEEDTRALWRSVATHDMTVYTSIRRKLSAANKGSRQRVPLKMYVAGSAIVVQAPVWATETTGEVNTLGKVISEQLEEFSKTAIPKVYIHGIDVDVLMEEAVLDVWTQFRYLDNFLYIVLIMD